MVNKKNLNRHNKKIQADLFGNAVKDFSSHKVNILIAKSKGEFRVDKYLTIKWEKGKTFIRVNSSLFELNNPELRKEIEQYISSPEYNSKDVDTSS